MERKHLALLRHAKSSWDDPNLDDRDRPLNQRGQGAADRIGHHVRDRAMVIDLVLCSSSRRTRQTLDLLQLPPQVEVLVEDELYDATAGDLLGRLHRVADAVTSVLVIGHNPAVQELAIELTGDQERLEAFPTAALADLRVPMATWDDLRPGIATLHEFVTPRELKRERPIVTRSRIGRDLRALGARPGGVLMVHTRMSALGWVVGGTTTVVDALLDVVGSEGTLLAYAGWEDDTWHLGEWPEERQQSYLTEMPPFDPVRSAANPAFGRVPERIRTWPGARASGGHCFRFVALGPRADELTRDAPWDYPVGRGSPLGRLVDAGGQVLALGSPLDALTILHHAEALVDTPERRPVTYRVPVRVEAEDVWRTVHDFDTSSRGAFPYERLGLDDDAFAVIARAALTGGAGRRGPVGASQSHLFDAEKLVAFAVTWLRERFGG